MKTHLIGLRELTEEVQFNSIINESTKKKTWNISTVTLRAEMKNANGRIYPKQVLQEAINEHIRVMPNGGCVGELMHPTNGDLNINLERVSHKFTDVQENGNDYLTKATVLDTPQGLVVQSLLENEVQLGLSSRAVGNLNHKKDASYVTKLHVMSLGDIVANPSCPGAFVQGLFENKEWIYQNGVVVGKDLSESLDEYKKIIESASPRQRKDAMVLAFRQYFKDILGD